MHLLAALFFLTVLAGAVAGLRQLVRTDLPLILAALGYCDPALARRPYLATADA